MCGFRKKSKLIAIKNFDEELYRLVKAYASLEGRTVASIFEEAIRQWLESRENYDEVYVWVMLEAAYDENFEAIKREVSRNPEKYLKGYVLACNGKVIGVYGSYMEASRKSREKCRKHGLILKLPLKEKVEEIELGFPW